MKQAHATLIWRSGTMLTMAAVHASQYSTALATTGLITLGIGAVATALVR
jgi:hypothetical protein